LLNVRYWEIAMPGPEEVGDNTPEPTEAEVVRGSAVLLEFMKAGWLGPMNPEDLDVIAYAVLKYRGASGNHTTIEDGPEIWETIETGTKDIISEHIAGQRALSAAQAGYVSGMLEGSTTSQNKP
jgi:hypothetical protein